jgi:hypothetical protein
MALKIVHSGVDNPIRVKRRTRGGFFTLGRTEVGVKRRAGFGWSQPGFFRHKGESSESSGPRAESARAARASGVASDTSFSTLVS